MALAKENQHWYSRDGSPVYEVPRADGKGMRSATLADARKLNLGPGVTGIINCAAKPGLERWKREQVLLAAMTLPRIELETEANWIKRVYQDSEEQARKAAEKGTRIHAAIEGFYVSRSVDVDTLVYVNGIEKEIGQKYPDQDWKAEKSYASTWGYGCKIDLHSENVIIDFKTKEFDDPTKKLAWDEQAMQLAANRIASGYKTAKCANVFVSTLVPGLVHIHEWPEDDLENAWDKFLALLMYWKADRKYSPKWQS